MLMQSSALDAVSHGISDAGRQERLMCQFGPATEGKDCTSSLLALGESDKINNQQMLREVH